MRGRSKRLAEDANVDLTPMLDVVFILLIFFIVTSTFLQEEAIGLEPPPPGCAGCEKLSPPAIVIYVDASDAIRVGSTLTDISAVRSSIERKRAENPDSAVIIQAAPEARTGTIINLRDLVYDAKVGRVNIVRSAPL